MTAAAPSRTRLASLLISAGILLAANGAVVTLVAVRAEIEGFSGSMIGLLGTAYFVGFFVACVTTNTLIRRAGHIRVFAALASLAAICSLVLILVVEPLVWLAARAVMGFAFAATATVVESWLNETARNADRGRILSFYRVVDLSAVTLGQFLIPWIGPGGFAVFAVVAILFCCALIPVSLSDHVSPPPPASARMRPKVVWTLSPVACASCVTIGLTNGAFRTVGPIYAGGVGLNVDQIALFMSAAIIAGAMLQYPLGMLSDRFDRRYVLIGATLGAAAASLSLALLGPGPLWSVYAGGFLFGGLALPLYSLSIAHANDHAGPGQFVEIAAGMTLFYALGASVGPPIAAFMIERFGPPSFFFYTSALHLSLVIFIIYRMSRRAAAERRDRFVGLLRTSPAMAGLTRGRSSTNAREEEGT
ncbi:MAG: MFS transporter [Geminicoccaceae bacterium]